MILKDGSHVKFASAYGFQKYVKFQLHYANATVKCKLVVTDPILENVKAVLACERTF